MAKPKKPRKKNNESGKKRNNVKDAVAEFWTLWSMTITALGVSVVVCIALYFIYASHLATLAEHGKVRVDALNVLIVGGLSGLSLIFVLFILWLEGGSNSVDRQKIQSNTIHKLDDDKAELIRVGNERRHLLNLFRGLEGTELLEESDEPLTHKELEEFLQRFIIAAKQVTTKHLAEIDVLKDDKVNAQRVIASLKSEQAERLRDLTAQIRGLEMQLQQATAPEWTTVSSGRDAMDQLEAKIRSLQESLDEMTKSRDMALNNLADKEHLITKLLLCVRYLQSLKSQNELLQEDNEVQLSSLLDAEEQVSDLEQQLAHLQECLDHQQRLQTATANDRNNAVTRIGVLSAEVEHSKSVIENERTVTKNLQADLQASGAEIADLTSQLESVVAEKVQLSEQVASLQTELKARPTVEVPAKQASVRRMGGSQAVGSACEKCAAHATTIRLLRQQVSFLNERIGQIAQTVADTLDVFAPADSLESANVVLSGGYTVLSTLVSELRKLSG